MIETQNETAVVLPKNEMVQEVEPSGLAPHKPRWIFLPIQDLQVESLDFRTNILPAMTFYPLEPFRNWVDTERGRIPVPRTTEGQFADVGLKTVVADRKVADLMDISLLEEEADQVEVFSVLMNRRVCEKYPFELGNQCATCWVRDIEEDLEARVEEKLQGKPALREVATKTARLLYEVLNEALTDADLLVNEALEQIDDKKMGKLRLYEYDLTNIYHTHREKPKFRTTAESGGETAEAMKQSAEAMTMIAEKMGDSTGNVSKEEIQAMIAEQGNETAKALEEAHKKIRDLEAVKNGSGKEED
jgi:hypothetical protein